MTSVGKSVVVNQMGLKEVARQTHMEPFGAAFDHPLAFCGELAKVGCEYGRCDDGARHCVRVGRRRDSVTFGLAGVWPVDLRDLPNSDSTDKLCMW